MPSNSIAMSSIRIINSFRSVGRGHGKPPRAAQRRKLLAAIGFAALVTMIVALRRIDRRRSVGRAAFSRRNENIERSVIIKYPVDKVYKFYRNFENLPSFLGDVIAIEPAGSAVSRWTIEGPLGIHLRWTVRVTEERANKLIKYETVSSSGLTTYWEIHFSPGSTPDETEIHEVMTTPLGRLGRAVLALIGKFPAEEMSSNLHRLKELLETGRVTDASYAMTGKFDVSPRNVNFRFPEGPSQAHRKGHKSTIWVDPVGRSFLPILSTPDAYEFAANSVLEIATRIAALPAALGLVTPLQAFGADFILSLPESCRVDIPSAQAGVTSRNYAHQQELAALRAALAEGWLFSDCAN
jgi:uncharacterized membrane protein